MTKRGNMERMPEDICQYLTKGASTSWEITKHLSTNGYRESAFQARTTKMLAILEGQGKVRKVQPRTKPTLWELTGGRQ